MYISTEKRDTNTVLNELEHSPHRFEFFQAIRLLEKKYSQDLNEFFRKVLRFYIKTSLAFPEFSLEKIDIQEKITVFTQLFGLNTTHGPMAVHYLETFLTDASLNETGLLDFINIFNHRILALFYQCWKKYRIYLDTQHRKILSAFTPQATDSYLYYAGIWAQHTRSAEGLAVIVGDYFRVPVEIVQHIGKWLIIPAKDRSCLGSLKGQYHALGQTTLLGRSIWDNLSHIKLILKIDRYDYFQTFFPEQSSFNVLCERVRSYIQLHYTFDVELQLVSSQVPICQLNQRHRLGWDSWLLSSGERMSVGTVVLKNL